MPPTKQTIIALSTVAATIILFASGPLVATHQTQAILPYIEQHHPTKGYMHAHAATHMIHAHAQFRFGHHHGENQQAISSFHWGRSKASPKLY